MDAITLLKEDHKTVEGLFKRFEQAGDGAHAAKREIVGRIIEELSKHAAIEEQLFYPVTRKSVPAVEDLALESLEEHHIVKWVLSELEDMDPVDERYDAKVTVLMENVRHHVEEEEDDYFPKVRDALGRNELSDLGDAMEKAKAIAPTHPHPTAPDTPPGNLLAGTGAGIVDRVTDTVSGVAQGSLAAAEDLIDRIRGNRTSRPAPQGSPTARKAATQVRKQSADVADRAVDATRRAKRTGETTATAAADAAKATGSAAKAGLRSTAKSASRAAKSTATTAKRSANATKSTAKRSANATKSTAKRSAKSTATTAKRSAKSTATTAKRSAKATATTAKRSAKATATTAKRSAAAAKSTAKRSAKATKSTAKRSSKATAKRSSTSAASTAKRPAKRAGKRAGGATKRPAKRTASARS